ncbi:MAG: DUF6055 domain-containing protein [Myxococcota bacterium]|nr:DUF6055 domain-containing protein [Myxococcota bacterium]
MVLLLLNMSALANHPCGTLDHLRQLEPNALQFQPIEDTEGSRSNKDEREAQAPLPNSQSSANFIVKWNGNLNGDAINRLLDAFEESWAVEIDALGHPAPAGTDQYLFNIYIGDTGGNAPSSYGAAGYFTLDNAYFPMIVVGKGTLENPEYADITAAHEFYHAIQAKTERYSYDESSPGAWLWESTATWASAEVYPGNLYYSSFLFSYALYPNYPLDYFNYPDTGTIDEYYQYGSFIFPLDVSQQLGGDLVREVWLDTTNEPDPVEVFRGLMAEQGVDFDSFFMDHSARMSQYDFPYGAQYEEYVEDVSGSFGVSGDTVAAVHSGEGTGGWVELPSSQPLHRYGYSIIRLDNPTEQAYQVFIDGDNVSNMGQVAFYGARLAVDSGGDLNYVDLTVDGEANLVDGITADTTLTLVIGAWSRDWSPGANEAFSFSYAIVGDDWVDPGAEPSGEPSGEPSSEPSDEQSVDTETELSVEASKVGCGCQSNQVPLTSTVGFLASLMIWSRRRRLDDEQYLSI